MLSLPQCYLRKRHNRGYILRMREFRRHWSSEARSILSREMKEDNKFTYIFKTVDVHGVFRDFEDKVLFFKANQWYNTLYSIFRIISNYHYSCVNHVRLLISLIIYRVFVSLYIINKIIWLELSLHWHTNRKYYCTLSSKKYLWPINCYFHKIFQSL